MGWKISDMPRLDGRTAVVTGGASGIGFQVARELGARGAQVTVLGRDAAKGQQAVRALANAGGSYAFEHADLASLASIAELAARWGERPIHLLMNVAGVMAVPAFTRTQDGFEAHMGTNFLGHFALTGRLLPALRAGRARVVTVSALVGRMQMAALDVDDLQAEQRYTPMGAYARSKLADILFAAELQRRGSTGGLTSVAVDPGTTVTNLQRHSSGVTAVVGNWLARLIGYPLQRVAENVLYAGVLADVAAPTLIGPSCTAFQRAASPKDVGLPVLARDEQVSARLWQRAEALTGVAFDFAGRA